MSIDEIEGDRYIQRHNGAPPVGLEARRYSHVLMEWARVGLAA